MPMQRWKCTDCGYTVYVGGGVNKEIKYCPYVDHGTIGGQQLITMVREK